MFNRFRRRSTKLERLDTGDYTPAEYSRWQREMVFIHSFLGEKRALRNSLLAEAAKENREVSILDVGAGAGEMLEYIAGSKSLENRILVGCEINEQAAASIYNKGFLSVRCDSMALPFADGSFDYVFCSLFLHHLPSEKAVENLTEMRRVARKQIFVIDLRRSAIAYYFYKIVGRLLLQRFTLEDGALSILRSFTPEELLVVAERAGLSEIKVVRSAAYRLILSAK